MSTERDGNFNFLFLYGEKRYAGTARPRAIASALDPAPPSGSFICAYIAAIAVKGTLTDSLLLELGSLDSLK